MADTDFYNLNLFRAYPLQDDSGVYPVGYDDSHLVDFGVIFLPKAEVAPDTLVRLANVSYGADGFCSWTFTVDGHSDLSIQFDMYRTGKRYRTFWESIRKNGVEDPSVGQAFLVLGQTEPVNIAPTPGQFSSSSAIGPQPCVEPACIQTLWKHYVSSLSVANDERSRSPDICSEAESHQMESSSAAQARAFLAPRAQGMTGDLKFKEGYNCSITVSETSNAIRFSARLGAGSGRTCYEIARTESEEAQQELGNPLDNALRCEEALYSVNGVGPTAEGHFRLVGGYGVDVLTEDDCIVVRARADLDQCDLTA